MCEGRAAITVVNAIHVERNKELFVNIEVLPGKAVDNSLLLSPEGTLPPGEDWGAPSPIHMLVMTNLTLPTLESLSHPLAPIPSHSA